MSRDVVIVGAGIMGLSIAYQIARRSSLTVTVLEKGNGIGEGSTGASSAVCRFRYSFDEVVHLARDGIEAYRRWPDFVELDAPRAQFHSYGVLWLPAADREWASREHIRMQRLGIRTAVLDDDDVAERYPALNVCTEAPDTDLGTEHACHGGGRHFLEIDGGYIDPMAAAADLLDACRARGVEVRFRSEVARVDARRGRVTGVTLADGSAVASPIVVNAAGPWCNRLFASLPLSVPWNLTPTRVQILHVDRPDAVVGDLPVCVDFAGGIYFRLQNRGQQIVVGSTREEDELEVVADPDHFDRFPDEAFLQAKLHALHHRIPALPYRGAVRGYCGLYTLNRDDVHPILGRTSIEGFIVANGFSGHGFKLAPAIGSLIAQEITGDKTSFDTDVPIGFFAIDRKPLLLGSKSVLA